MTRYRIKSGYSSGTVALGVMGIIFLFLIICGISAFLGGLIIWALWNWVVPAFGGPVISYWLAVGIGLVLGFIGSIFRSTHTTNIS